MSWNDDDRELLTRCVKAARAGEHSNPGMLSRFYKTLSSCRSLMLKSMAEEDLEIALDALSVAGRPPMDTSRRAETALLDLSRNSRVDAIRDASTDALIAYWNAHPPDGPTAARELSESGSLDTSRRFRFALIAGEPEDLARATPWVSEASLDLDELKALQQRLLRNEPQNSTTFELLEELYVHGSWMGRRVLIRQLGEGHEALVPTLARVARRADPSTRRAVVSALGRIGHVSVEPVLLTLIDEVEPSVLPDVVAALGAHGTRACLPRLSQLREDADEFAEVVDAAISRLDARFPSDARAGALSLAESGSEGALSLAGASPGDVSLYRDVERALDEHALIEGPTTAPATQDHWHRLANGPRAVPFGYTLYELGFGYSGSTFVLSIISSIGFIVGTYMTVLAIPVLILSVMSFTVSLPLYRRRHAALRDGQPSYAELRSYQYKRSNEHNGHYYTFCYMDELEETHDVELVFEERRPDLEDDALEPLLFTPGGSVMLFDEVRSLTVSDEGQLVSTNRVAFLGALGPLLILMSLTYWILQTFG